MVRGITERDHALFRKLGDFGVLSTGQLRELFFKDIRKTTMLRRLRILEKRDLIRRVHGLSDGSHGWCLTLKCANRFGIEGVFRHINRNALEHDVTLSQVRMSLQSVGLGDTWVPEHVLRHRAWLERKQTGKVPENIPDGILTFEKKGEYLAIAVELEMTEKNSDRYVKTLQAHRFKRTISMIWYLVPTKALGLKLERIWRKYNTTNERLRWTLISQVLKAPYDIEINANGKSNLLRDYITMSSPIPAHSTAHGVSSICETNLISQEGVNSKNT